MNKWHHEYRKWNRCYKFYNTTKYDRFFFHNSYFIVSVTIGQNGLSKVLNFFFFLLFFIPLIIHLFYSIGALNLFLLKHVLKTETLRLCFRKKTSSCVTLNARISELPILRSSWERSSHPKILYREATPIAQCIVGFLFS